MAKISDELNAVGCCKCSGSSARPCHGATTTTNNNNPNRPPLSISLPGVNLRHAQLMMQLLYTGRVNIEGGEEDRQGLLDLLERLDIKMALHSDFTMAPAQPLTLAWCAVNRSVTSSLCRLSKMQTFQSDSGDWKGQPCRSLHQPLHGN